MPVPAQRNPVLQHHRLAQCVLDEIKMDPRVFAMPTLVKVARVAEMLHTSRTNVYAMLDLLVAEGYVVEVRRNARGCRWLMVVDVSLQSTQRAA